MKEGEVGSVEERGRLGRAIAAEDTATLPAVLKWARYDEYGTNGRMMEVALLTCLRSQMENALRHMKVSQ